MRSSPWLKPGASALCFLVMSRRGGAVPGTDTGLNAEPARAESVSLAGEDAYGRPERVVPKAVLNDVYADASYDIPALKGCPREERQADRRIFMASQEPPGFSHGEAQAEYRKKHSLPDIYLQWYTFCTCCTASGPLLAT
ncbi:hypothetical protein SAMN02746089_02058 [Caldanaerobius fijiensis DSM 17918]|uniref:Uncharacterized protein n=1 Tax=Caldanaerobius fijiensis DSM 17918 TaxID=1121256 RepID=A0A1M5C7Y3_9THEO|nr:hypothetical protein SAMN02746089_02058 [Caldanaerobius fijiensis DSM 17918]